MHLDSQYSKIVKATTGKDTSRPVLQALHVTRTGPTTGELAAADGFILAVVPCTLDEDDVPGLISAECLAAAFKASGKALRGAQMMLSADRVRIMDGTDWPRPEGQFPDYSRIVPRLEPVTTLCPPLNPRLLCNLKDAIGVEYNGGSLQAQGDTGPVILHTRQPQDRHPVAPYGVIMPLCATGTGWFTRTDATPAVDHAQCVSDHSQCADRATLDDVTRERDAAIEASKMHLARVQELLGENQMLTRDNETMTGLSNTRTDQRDQYARLLAAAETRIAALQDQLKATEETAAPIAGAAIEPVGPLHARLAAQFYCACGAHYDEACQCPDAALPCMAGASEPPVSEWAAWAASQPRWGTPAHALTVRGWPPIAGGSEPAPTPGAPLAAPAVPERMQGLPVATGESYQRPHRHKCIGANDTGCGAAWECGPRCSDPRLWYRFCPTCQAQYQPPDPQAPAAREAAPDALCHPHEMQTNLIRGRICIMCQHGHCLEAMLPAEWAGSRIEMQIGIHQRDGCPLTHAAREAAQRADEAECHTHRCTNPECDEGYDCYTPGCEPERYLCDTCAAEQDCPCPDCTQRADEAELQAGLLATLPPMAGGSEDAAHTPGPWRWTYQGDSRATVDAPRRNRGGQRFTMAEVEAFSPAETQANARLIAAAPALLEACRAAAEYISQVCGTDGTPTLDVLRAAIAQATLPPMAGGASTCFYCEHHGDGVVPATRQITFVDNDAPRAEWVCDACARAYFPDAQLAPPPMAGGSGEDTLHPDCSPDDPEVRLIICPECGQMEWWTEQECQDHGKCRADSGPCPVCLPPMAGGSINEEERNAASARTYRCPACAHSYPTDDAMLACFDSHVPTPADDPAGPGATLQEAEPTTFAFVTDQGTAMAETALCHRHHYACNIESAHLIARTTPDYDGGMMEDCTGNDALECQVCGGIVRPAPHTHPCPACHQARACTGTGCADGPRECSTCSQCRGW